MYWTKVVFTNFASLIFQKKLVFFLPSLLKILISFNRKYAIRYVFMVVFFFEGIKIRENYYKLVCWAWLGQVMVQHEGNTICLVGIKDLTVTVAVLCMASTPVSSRKLSLNSLDLRCRRTYTTSAALLVFSKFTIIFICDLHFLKKNLV